MNNFQKMAGFFCAGILSLQGFTEIPANNVLWLMLVLLIGLPHLMDGISLWDVCKLVQEGTVQTFRDISGLVAVISNACNSALN